MAIVLAWLGSRWRLKELVWLLYPWMAFGAIKLILEDFGQGQPATLFVSLLCLWFGPHRPPASAAARQIHGV